MLDSCVVLLHVQLGLVLRFKIWHYSGTLLYERPWNKQEELWEVLWQLFPSGVFHEPVINYKPVEGIQPSQPQGASLRILFMILQYWVM